MRQHGIRVLSPFRYWPKFVGAALIGLGAGLCWTGIFSLLLPIAVGLLALPIIWARRDQHRILFPLRTGLLFSSAYVGPILIHAHSMFAGAPLSRVFSVIEGSLILFAVGSAWGAVVRLLFQAIAYQVFLGAEGCCRACAYDLTGVTNEVCPECGTVISSISQIPPRLKALTWPKRLPIYGGILMTLLLLAIWTASWVYTFSTHLVIGELYWNTQIKGGGIQLSGYSVGHGGHSSEFDSKMTAIVPLYNRTNAGGITLIIANVPLWIPFALVAYPTCVVLFKPRKSPSA